MLLIFLIEILATFFCAVSFITKKYPLQERTLKITKPLSLIINLSPLVGLVIFSILFAFVLKGRLAERATHALLVFALWMYATRFYQYILSFYKNKKIVICSIAGMIYSVALAIILTPLDRYVSLIYSDINLYIILLNCMLLGVFYATAYRRLTNRD